MIRYGNETFNSKKEQLGKSVQRAYDDICYYHQMGMQERRDFVNRKMSEVHDDDMIIPYVSVQITNKCSLNCKNCVSLIPDFKGTNWDFSWEKTKHSLEKVLSLVKEIITVRIVGGESFIVPNFEEILDFFAAQKNILSIEVPTNATVVPNERIISKLRDCNAIVRISDYGLFEKVSTFVAAMENGGG